MNIFVQSAERTTARNFPKPRNLEARAGLSYERKFVQALINATRGTKTWLEVEHNPWFKFRDIVGEKVCCPDVVAFDIEEQFAIVIEVKQTLVPFAFEKLKTLYCPVVSRALNIPTKPLVVCRSLTPGAPNPASRISLALTSEFPLYQWLGGKTPVLF